MGGDFSPGAREAVGALSWVFEISEDANAAGCKSVADSFAIGVAVSPVILPEKPGP
jgi:hypothetical protein